MPLEPCGRFSRESRGTDLTPRSERVEVLRKPQNYGVANKTQIYLVCDYKTPGTTTVVVFEGPVWNIQIGSADVKWNEKNPVVHFKQIKSLKIKQIFYLSNCMVPLL